MGWDFLIVYKMVGEHANKGRAGTGAGGGGGGG